MTAGPYSRSEDIPRPKRAARPSPKVAILADPLAPARGALEAGDEATARRLLEAELAAAIAARESPAGRAALADIERGRAVDALRSAGATPEDRAVKALASLDKAEAILRPPAGLILGALPLAAADLSAPLPPIEWTSRDLQLGPGRPNLLVGYSESGKSLAGLALSLAVAAGLPIFGQFRATQRRVLLLPKDSGVRAVKGRLQRLARGLGVELGALVNDGWLRVVPCPKVTLTSLDAGAAYRAAAEGFGLCFLDAFRGFIPGMDENDSRVRDHLDTLNDASNETGCAFLVVHHEGKGGNVIAGRGGRGAKPDNEAARGSAGIQDATGTGWRMERENIEGKDHFRMRMAKPPEEPPGPKPEQFFLVLEDLVSEDGRDRRWGLRVSYRTTEQIHGPTRSPDDGLGADVARVAQAVKEHAGTGGVAGADVVARLAGMKGTAARTAVKVALQRRLIRNGATKQDGSEDPRRPRYFPT